MRWRFVATEDDRASNHKSCRFVSHFRRSSHENDSFLGCQESVFFNADLNEVIYVHPDKPVQGWTLLVASEGTVRDSHGISDVG